MQQQETGNKVRLWKTLISCFIATEHLLKTTSSGRNDLWESSAEGFEQVRLFYSHSSSICHPASAFIHAAADATDTVPLIDLSFAQPPTLLWGGNLFAISPSTRLTG